MVKTKTRIEADDLTIEPTSDIFTAILWSAPKNEPILRDFLNATLVNSQQPIIQQATVQNPFKVKEFAPDRQLVLDVRVRDELSRWYNLEVQTAAHTAFRERMLLHWADVFSSLLRTGEDFTKLVPVKSIVLAAFPIFPELRNLHTIFEIRARENPDVLLTDYFQMHFLRLGDLIKRRMEGLKELYGGLQDWLNFFTYAATVTEDKMAQLVNNNPTVLTAYEEFQRFTADAEMRDLERRRRRFLEDQRLYIDAAKDEGIAIGKAEGKAEGRAEGKAEGRVEEKFEIAKNLKQAGSDFAFIAQMTGLSRSEIERLN